MRMSNYLPVFFFTRPYGSSLLFVNLRTKELSVVAPHGLDARLVMHVRNEFRTCIVRPAHRPITVFRLDPEEILHIHAMYTFII